MVDAKTTSPGRAEQVQWIKFLSFLLVFLWHTNQWTASWAPGGNGAACSVALFIMMSGATSGYMHYGQDVKISASGMLKHVKKKLARFYPLYLLTTLYTVIYTDLPNLLNNGNFSGMREMGVQLIRNVFLVQSWFPDGYFSYNGVGWFLSTLMFLYLINQPLLAILGTIRKNRHSGLLYAGVIVLLSALTVLYCHLMKRTNVEYTEYVLPVARVGEYCIGILLGFMARRLMTKGSRVLQSILEVASLALWIWMVYQPASAWQFRIVRWMLPNMLLVFVFLRGGGILSGLFSSVQMAGDNGF